MKFAGQVMEGLSLYTSFLYGHIQIVQCARTLILSLSNCKLLQKKGMNFIEVVKTATKRYPMTYLGTKRIIWRAILYSMVYKSSEIGVEICAVLWVDFERQYFVSTNGITLHGRTIYRERWRPVGNVSKNTTKKTRLQKLWNNTARQRHGLIGTIDVDKVT